MRSTTLSPPYRRKGLGTTLVQKCLATLKRLRIVKCCIFLFNDNSDGEQFWKANDRKKPFNICLAQKNLLSSRHKRCC